MLVRNGAESGATYSNSLAHIPANGFSGVVHFSLLRPAFKVKGLGIGIMRGL